MTKLIIFDAEGVVISTPDLWDKQQEILLERRGKKYNRARTKHHLTGRSIAEGSKILIQHYDLSDDPEKIVQERIDIIKELLINVEYVEGFQDFYARISGNYKTCVGTAMDRDLLKIVNLKLSKVFGEHVYSVSDVQGKGKPDPAIFLYCAEKMGIDPKDCVVIEDAPHGITAAKRAGMKCIGITTTFDADKLQEADEVVDRFNEITLI